MQDVSGYSALSMQLFFQLSCVTRRQLWLVNRELVYHTQRRDCMVIAVCSFAPLAIGRWMLGVLLTGAIDASMLCVNHHVAVGLHAVLMMLIHVAHCCVDVEPTCLCCMIMFIGSDPRFVLYLKA
jgi:hypothetical protein